MLGNQHVVVGDTTQAVAVSPWILSAARSRPGWRCYLQNETVAVVVPGEHSLGVTPRAGTTGTAARYLRVVIELIVPDDVVQATILDLVERGADRVYLRV